MVTGAPEVRVRMLAAAVAALVVAAVVGLWVVGSDHGSGQPALRTTPGTISPDLGAGSQCPDGAYDGHCIAPATTGR